ncbi:hypothetical protein ACFLW8_06240 [Chloroflexota bacterium]
MDRLEHMGELSSGIKYSPQYIEGRLRFSPYIKDAMVVGGKDKEFVSAIVNMDFVMVGKWAEQALLGLDEVSRFQLIVGRKGQRDELTLNVELEDEAIDREKLGGKLSKEFQSVCRVKLDNIEFVQRGTIAEQHQTIVDERTWD